MFNFVPSTIPHNIFVIGAGGTGSRLMPMLAQFLRSITRGVTAQGWIENPNVWLIDDDVVEQKNILRQNFIEMDVGKHKASVVAERYSRAYNVNIVPILHRVNSENTNRIHETVVQTIESVHNITTTIHAILDSAIVIICVDSVEARRDILNTFITQHGTNRSNTSGRTFFIDAGNEDNFGQVQFFTPTIAYGKDAYNAWNESYKVPKLVPVAMTTDYIPMPYEFYRDLVDTPAQGSCADLNQTLAINAIMATQIMGIVQNYFYRKPMNYNTVSISLNGGNFTTHNTFNEFKNRSITSFNSAFSSGTTYSREKDGKTKNLRFTKFCNYVNIADVAAELREEINRAEAEAQKAARKAAAEEKKRLADEKKKKEDEERALKAVEAVAEPLIIPPPPPLTPAHRVRNRVELAVPDAWVAQSTTQDVTIAHHNVLTETADVLSAVHPELSTVASRRTRLSQSPYAQDAQVALEALSVAEALEADGIDTDGFEVDENW